ncbi:MAG: HAMP domain-containing protein, partial [Ilumatobacteraceae bacterium]
MYPLTLRAKTILIGIVVAGVLSLVASASTFFLTKEFLLRQRETGAVTQVLAAARLASSALVQSDESLAILSASAQLLPGSRAALYQSGSWKISGVGFTNFDIPESLLAQLENGLPARQRAMVGSDVSILVGFPLPNYLDTWFVGVVPLNELERSLEVLRTTLLVGSILAALGGGVIGNWVSRRMMEPLREFSSTAREVSLGDLTKRVNEPREPDLARIAQIFNEMTVSLQRRIEREARFGATVSHELRSPLTVIRTASDIIASM